MLVPSRVVLRVLRARPRVAVDAPRVRRRRCVRACHPPNDGIVPTFPGGAAAAPRVLVEGVGEGVVDVLEVRHGDRVRASGRRDDGTIAEVAPEQIGIQRRGHHHQLQRRHPALAAAARQRPEEREKEVTVERALVDLVEHDVRRLRQERVAVHLAKQHARRHEHEPGVPRHRRVEPDVVAHEAPAAPDAVPLAPFLGDALGDGERGDAPGLGADDATPGADSGVDGVVEEVLGHLGRLTAPSLSAHHSRVPRSQRAKELVPERGDGQGVAELAHGDPLGVAAQRDGVSKEPVALLPEQRPFGVV